MQRAYVQCPVRELRSHMLYGIAKKQKYPHKQQQQQL